MLTLTTSQLMLWLCIAGGVGIVLGVGFTMWTHGDGPSTRKRLRECEEKREAATELLAKKYDEET